MRFLLFAVVLPVLAQSASDGAKGKAKANDVELQKVVLVPSEGFPRADILIAVTKDLATTVEWRDLDGTLLATIHLDLKTKRAVVVNVRPDTKVAK